jgi:WD40 repeat protein/protein-tyrosine-phosphatase
MDKARLEDIKKRLYSTTLLVGGWQRRKAATELAQAVREQDLDAVRLLLEALTEKNDDTTMRALVTEGLAEVKGQSCIDVVCNFWVSNRRPEVGALLSQYGWVASAPATAQVLSALKAGKVEAVINGGRELFPALWQALRDGDSDVARGARESLERLNNPDLIDALCEQWAKDRDETLATIIRQRGLVARQPLKLQVLTALKASKADLITKLDSGVVEVLLQACQDRDPQITQQARQSLGQLQQPAAQDQLCRFAMENNTIAREVAINVGFAPQDAYQKALFYFFTEQWAHYEAADPDQRHLQTNYAQAEARLRAQIDEKARKRGYRVVAPVYADRKRLLLTEMTDSEWTQVLTAIDTDKPYAGALQLAQVAASRWSWQVLQRLQQASWRPKGEQQQGYEELLQLAARCELVAGHTEGNSYATLEGHQEVINCLAISPDGRYLASGSQDKTVGLWSLPQGQLIARLTAHSGAINCLLFTPDNKTLISGSADGSVRLWNLDGTLRHTLTGHGDEVTCVSLNTNGTLLASGSLDNSIRFWSLADGVARQELREHTGAVWAVQFNNVSNLLASGGGLSDHSVRLWQAVDGQPQKILEGHRGLVRCLTFTSDGKYLLSGSGDNTIRMWDVHNGSEVHMLRGHKGLVHSLLLSPDNRWLASGSVDKSMRIWDLAEAKEVKRFERHKDRITALICDHNWRAFYSASWDSTIKLMSLNGKQEFKTLQGHTSWVTCLALTPDSQILASGSRECVIRLWKVKPSLITNLPSHQITNNDRDWIEKAVQNQLFTTPEHPEMEFTAALLRWQHRLNNNRNGNHTIEVAQFDIEI